MMGFGLQAQGSGTPCPEFNALNSSPHSRLTIPCFGLTAGIPPRCPEPEARSPRPEAA